MILVKESLTRDLLVYESFVRIFLTWSISNKSPGQDLGTGILVGRKDYVYEYNEGLEVGGLVGVRHRECYGDETEHGRDRSRG